MLVVAIPEREFNLYALALPRGPNFEPYVVVSGWKCDNARSIGGVLLNHDTGDFGIRAFRRRIDHCFVTVASKFGFNSQDAALVELTAAMRPGELQEPIPPGSKKRRPLLPATAKNVHETFRLLTSTITHYPGSVNFNEDEYRKFIRTLSDEELIKPGKQLLILCGDVVTPTPSTLDCMNQKNPK